MMLRGVVFVVVMTMMSSCYYDNGEYLYPNSGVACHTLNVNYTTEISTIIYQTCATAGCHVEGTGRVPLSTYQEVKISIDDGSFVQRAITRRDMPPSGPMSSCNIKKIESWINNGTLND